MTLKMIMTDNHENNPRKISDIVDTISNLQLDDLNSKPHGGPILRDLINRKIGARLYPPPGSIYHPLPCLENFYGPTHHETNSHDKSNTKNEVYNVLCKDHMGKLYHVLSDTTQGKHIMFHVQPNANS